MNENYTHDEMKELLQLQEIFLITLAEMVGSKDFGTGEHIQRTAQLVKIISQELKERGYYQDEIDDNFIRNLSFAAPLHDVGKINTPDAILMKPGKLTNEEFEQMKQHTIVGGEIIQKIIDKLPKDSHFMEILKVAKNVALYHHEKWNGTGYPSGMVKDDIPLAARIMTVADVFDAMTSKRCYKDEMPADLAYQEILDKSGIYFDPIVVKAFSNAVEKGKIYQKC